MSRWVRVCSVEDIDVEDVYRFDHSGQPYAVYNAKSGFFATHDICSHEHAHLSDGFVIGDVIECPRHQGRFHIPSGRALSPPACENIRTYEVRVEAGEIFIALDDTP